MTHPQLDIETPTTKTAWVEGEYRYSLGRTWDPTLPRVCWILLNPSVADADQDDPTLRRCIAFSRREGFGSLVLVNLFARRCTRPVHLNDPGDPVGPENTTAITQAVSDSLRVIVGWGAHRLARRRGYALSVRAAHYGHEDLWCLGLTSSGAPRHPLYVRGDAKLVRWTS